VLTNRPLPENPAVDVEKMDGKRRGIFSVKLPKIPNVQPACDHFKRDSRRLF
jgi:hypothetical protein